MDEHGNKKGVGDSISTIKTLLNKFQNKFTENPL